MMYLFKYIKFEHSPPVGVMGTYPPPNGRVFGASLLASYIKTEQFMM